MASKVDICNSAMNMLGASNIVALTEDSKNARLLNQRFDFVRDAVFQNPGISFYWECRVYFSYSHLVLIMLLFSSIY